MSHSSYTSLYVLSGVCLIPISEALHLLFSLPGLYPHIFEGPVLYHHYCHQCHHHHAGSNSLPTGINSPLLAPPDLIPLLNFLAATHRCQVFPCAFQRHNPMGGVSSSTLNPLLQWRQTQGCSPHSCGMNEWMIGNCLLQMSFLGKIENIGNPLMVSIQHSGE